MAQFEGEMMKLFTSRSRRVEWEVSFLGWSWWIRISGKKRHLMRLVQHPARSARYDRNGPALTSFYVVTAEFTQFSLKIHWNTKTQWNTSQVSLFIHFLEQKFRFNFFLAFLMKDWQSPVTRHQLVQQKGHASPVWHVNYFYTWVWATYINWVFP